MLSPNTVLQNRYRVIRQLGEGGMGAVYEAIDDRVSCVVAVKEILLAKDIEPHRAIEARRAFEREAALLANLRHASLPKVTDHFTEDDGQFLVMEYVPGYDLAELMEVRGTAFPLAQVTRWADELLKVLEYLHGRKPPILHRDIKPSNMKLTRQGEIFLLDFGLAKGSAGQMPTLLTSRSVRGYTPIYASFEQIYGKGTDPRSDLYSLGATLYHLLTGVPPKDAPTRFDALEDEQSDPLPPIQQLNPQIPSSVAAVIHRAMAVSRKGRPANATEMRRALHEALEETQRAETERLEQLEREKEQAAEAARMHAEAEVARQRAEEEARRKAEEEARLTAEAEARRKAEEAARILAEEEERRKQDEAEALRLQAEERRLREKEERRKRDEEERRRREAEQEETRRLMEQTKAAQAKGGDAVAAQTQGAKVMGAPPATPGVKTLEGKPDQLYKSADDLNPLQAGAPPHEAATATGKNGERLWMIVGIAILAFIIIIAVVRTSQKGSVSSQSAQQPKVNNAQSPSVPPPSEKASQPIPPAGMAYVPGGEFTMGRNGDKTGYESPAHSVTVKPFFIDIHEVTNEDYAKFVKAMNHLAPPGWANGNYSAGSGRRPVTGVTWDDAIAYANWVGKRLPTEEEWEFAARGTDGRRYPWDNSWRAGLANADGVLSRMADVGTYKGASPFGALDMVGNAWEWTASKMIPYPGGSLSIQIMDDLKVIRGGSFESNRNQATTTYRRGWHANAEDDYSSTGFRCVKDMEPSAK